MARISGSKAASCPRRNWSSAAMCGASIANTPPNGCGVPVGEMTALGVLVIDGRILARNHEITTQLSLLAGLPSLLRNLVDLDEGGAGGPSRAGQLSGVAPGRKDDEDHRVGAAVSEGERAGLPLRRRNESGVVARLPGIVLADDLLPAVEELQAGRRKRPRNPQTREGPPCAAGQKPLGGGSIDDDAADQDVGPGAHVSASRDVDQLLRGERLKLIKVEDLDEPDARVGSDTRDEGGVGARGERGDEGGGHAP